ncbi:MAG TPA: MBL fold metallo-hydrolase [Myxococcales bacterium]|jgi:glyoxylase-like metal-dependent hydrolase (beta-lactamase superfamily II)|nr:MBL fold metallo-hydrolase [Myxococcales bacterium]
MHRLLFVALLCCACNLREFATDRAVGAQVKFIPDPDHLSGWELTKLSGRVYTFRWTWDRSLVVLTSEGFVVTDPFNAEAARILAGELARIAPGQPVHTMFYSHYHLDHVVGGAALHPRHVVAHARCPAYWTDLRDTPETAGILPPTELIEGDKKYVIGGVEFDLLYLGHTHTDTLYAFYLPGEKVLHTADLGLVRTVFPIGGPDMYTPGILQQLDRLALLDFDTFIPSHFGYGNKQDFLEAVEFNKAVRRLSLAAIAKYGVPDTEAKYLASFHSVYDPLKAKYGGYHGFEEEALFIVARSVSGALLGY